QSLLRTPFIDSSLLSHSSELRIQTNHPINRHARVHRNLPFLPCYIQVHRLEIFPRRGLLRQKWNQCAEFPAGAKGVAVSRSSSAAASDVITRIGNDRVRQNSRLDQLRGRQSTAIANGP